MLQAKDGNMVKDIFAPVKEKYPKDACGIPNASISEIFKLIPPGTNYENWRARIIQGYNSEEGTCPICDQHVWLADYIEHEYVDRMVWGYCSNIQCISRYLPGGSQGPFKSCPVKKAWRFYEGEFVTVKLEHPYPSDNAQMLGMAPHYKIHDEYGEYSFPFATTHPLWAYINNAKKRVRPTQTEIDQLGSTSDEWIILIPKWLVPALLRVNAQGEKQARWEEEQYRIHIYFKKLRPSLVQHRVFSSYKEIDLLQQFWQELEYGVFPNTMEDIYELINSTMGYLEEYGYTSAGNISQKGLAMFRGKIKRIKRKEEIEKRKMTAKV